MSERKYTLVEYHNHGSGPNFFPDLFQAAEPEPEEEHSDEEDEDGSSRGLRIFLALIVLIGVAIAVKYFRGDDEDDEGPMSTQEVAVTEFED